jgi:hypothetical protein
MFVNRVLSGILDPGRMECFSESSGSICRSTQRQNPEERLSSHSPPWKPQMCDVIKLQKRYNNWFHLDKDEVGSLKETTVKAKWEHGKFVIFFNNGTLNSSRPGKKIRGLE